MAAAVARRKIAFITDTDASDRRNHSGTPYYAAYFLEKYCGDVYVIDKLIPSHGRFRFILTRLRRKRSGRLVIEYVKNRLANFFGKKGNWRVSLPVARFCASEITEQLHNRSFDCIWVEKSSTSMGFLDTGIPVIYESDATFRAMLDYYPSFTGWSREARKSGDFLERQSLEKASVVVFTNEWARISAINDYGIAPHKVHVLPSPPNCEEIPEKHRALGEKKSTTCTLLFIGVDWLRKGGDRAIGIAEAMNRRGVKTVLHICGCIPPRRYQKLSFVHIYGYLDKNRASDRKLLETIFLDAHFFIMPSRAECMGISFTEAMAYGLPLIATDTGGVATVVRDGQNGMLFPQTATCGEIAAAVETAWSDKERYRAMRCEARRAFDEELSGEVWASAVNRILETLQKKTSPESI